MVAKLVSILTPCYNGSKFIHRLFDSILIQSYPNIEMFVIDDGSKDNSAEIIKSYKPKFESKGYSLTYIYQENAGQSAAINKGLKLFKGDYLVWPDSDDFYALNNAIEQMVNVLEYSDDSVSLVRCYTNLLDENTLKLVGSFQTNINSKNKVDLFDDCLYNENGFWFGAGNYMAKTTKLLQYIPNKEIYTEKDAGQNWQLLLPLLYDNKCITIQNFLYNILVRIDSHSRGQYSTFDKIYKKQQSYENTLIQTLQNMNNILEYEKIRYLKKLHLKYKIIKLSTCIEYNRKELSKELYNEIKAEYHNQIIPNIIIIKYYFSLIPFGNIFYKVCFKAFKLMKFKIS